MKAELIIPIESLKGKLRKDGYYFRMYSGQQIVQRCPTKWEDTPARKAAKYCEALKHREWLYIVEVMDLSDYAGYDLVSNQ